MLKSYIQPIQVPWRSAGALFFFGAAFLGFSMGVGVSERPDLLSAGPLTRAYYSLSLFVIGGVDLGTPQGGPWFGQLLVWLSYFGSPILAASTLIEALVRAMSPQSWQLRRMRDHIIVVGGGPLTFAYLRVLRNHSPKVSVVVVCNSPDVAAHEEFKEAFGATVVAGDVTHDYFLQQLKPDKARKIMLLSDDSLRSYEAASHLLSLVPGIGDRVVIHCSNLRFMRAMANTRVAQACETFNTYHLAAAGLVRSQMINHFHATQTRDVVVLAGFGRFGQTILEELQKRAKNELDTVAILDIDAQRRVRIADEQMEFEGGYRRELYEGDIANPEVWDRLRNTVSLEGPNTVFVLGTGREEDNLRTALWLRRKYPEAMVIARSAKESLFAAEVGEEHNIVDISINKLVEEHIPKSWIEQD